ncbi:MAG: HD-GYP domain-containing protein, partial [Tumebacillaceae bacterium]
HLFGRIVGIADVYDALTTNRVYRKAFLPHEALEYLFSSTGQFDSNLIAVFRDHVAIYPIGLLVTLSNGVKAVVVDINTKYPQRPIVRVLKDENGADVTPYEVDLSQDFSLTVTECEDIL